MDEEWLDWEEHATKEPIRGWIPSIIVHETKPKVLVWLCKYYEKMNDECNQTSLGQFWHIVELLRFTAIRLSSEQIKSALVVLTRFLLGKLPFGGFGHNFVQQNTYG